jgi:cytochrome c oxidase assembly factor CtaG
MRQVIRAAIVMIIVPLAAIAHADKPHNFDELIRTWSFDPLVVILLIVSSFVYITGTRNLWSAGGRGHGILVWEAIAFGGGWLSMFVALVSPLHPWGEVLFSAHMSQHEILMLISAPLLVLGRPFIAAMWCLPHAWRRPIGSVVTDAGLKSAWRKVTSPFVAWAIHAIALWTWHVPFLFQATLESDLVHTLQHASFFLSALLFWWAIICGGRGPSSYGAGVLYLFTTSVHSGLLGVLLTLTTRVWYPVYSDTTASWGLSPIEDQQLGGLIMWVPAAIVYIVAALFMFTGWLHESENRARRQERRLVDDAATVPVGQGAGDVAIG